MGKTRRRQRTTWSACASIVAVGKAVAANGQPLGSADISLGNVGPSAVAGSAFSGGAQITGAGADTSFSSLRSVGDLGSVTGLDVGAPVGTQLTLNKAFHYADIAAHLCEPASRKSVEECAAACVTNSTCAAWEVCAPIGDGCDGCYLIRRAPRRFAERSGWHAEVLQGREEFGWGALAEDENMTYEACQEFLLEANGADQSKPFHEPAIMQKYTNCGFMVRDEEKPKQAFISGQHWPTFVVTNFWDPQVSLPREVEQEMFAARGQQRSSPPAPTPGVTSHLHAQVGTVPWEDHLLKKPRGPHAFIIPFYDTNIGHWMKQHGSMNPLQSYEMQSLLQAGDTVIDVGANLGCYTIPFAERVGVQGKVLAFEPFRWLNQIVAGNVAMNGLSNVWVFPFALGAQNGQIEVRPPQLRFFSSPGGMKVQGQQTGLKNDEAAQLFDWDFAPEVISVVSLDELLAVRNPQTVVLGAPPVDNIRLIKIDVEGMEKDVIMGAQKLIYHFKPIIWTENVAYFETKGQDTSFLQIMDHLEYACAQAQNAPNDIICTDRMGRGNQIGV